MATVNTEGNGPGHVGADAGPRCPHLDGYAPLSPGQLANPYPMWAHARATAPVFYDERLGMWSVTRYQDVVGVLRDPETFSSAEAFALRQPRLPEELATRIPPGFWRPRMLVAHDPPEHTKLRRLAQKAFTRERVAALEPFIRSTCHQLVDRFPERGEVDLMVAYANALPLKVITSILGFEADEGPDLRQWTEDFLVMATPARDGEDDDVADAQIVGRIERMVAMTERCAALVEERRQAPRDDVISALVQAADTGDVQVAPYDLVTLALELVIAGNDTTANLISHMVHYLLEDRPLWEQLLADRTLVPAAVEETLRRRGSSKGLFRRATADVTIGEAQVRSGDILHVLFASANHDEALFTDPERFDLYREKVGEHVGFGRFRHSCLGAPLARLEGRVALEVLLERIPGLEPVPEQHLEYAPTLTTQTLLHYRVSVPRFRETP
ncbi:MAG: putative cytochrome P450 hydroxylase [uncultured Arthrobacter sp.]|uniref:Putative cytochrome P450 hydroxylase n=1 Tax=uncultured Arthrobacter sp. TaxID=114050 RepID=A0A6J4JCS1_9MICC|nr:cytochrome P450 [uncultured Arthrobacter sp.]CAA9273200.1 MAG: putative cytochrome P450 hydroxylase [uncultured Arthrobacter sp.]